jgi:hypothetical protein
VVCQDQSERHGDDHDDRAGGQQEPVPPLGTLVRRSLSGDPRPPVLAFAR